MDSNVNFYNKKKWGIRGTEVVYRIKRVRI